MFRCLTITVGFISMGAGCEGRPTSLLPTESSPPPLRQTRDYDPTKTGSIRGQVRWRGPLPEVPPIQAVTTCKLNGPLLRNPHTPQIHPVSHGIAGAAVYLETVDLARAKPWDLPPATIIIDDEQIVVRMGDGPSLATGFTRIGAPVRMLSNSPWHQMLRAREAAYWTLPFPRPDQPLTRVFRQPGRVELSNAAGKYWQSAELFVGEHPYYTLSDENGRFRLEQIPEGPCRVMISVRNWHIAADERDPETGLILRRQYRPPVQYSLACEVRAGEFTELDLTLTLHDFTP